MKTYNIKFMEVQEVEIEAETEEEASAKFEVGDYDDSTENFYPEIEITEVKQ